MKSKLLFIHALSPLHVGTGQGVGVIDQPIAREKATNIPYLPGSSIKGVFRDACDSSYDSEKKVDCEKIFGPKTDNADAFAGSVSFSDARLLLLPVRSIAGVFAWVTSPYVLQRFNRDLKMINQSPLPVPKFQDDKPGFQEDEVCLVCSEDSPLVIGEDQPVILEDIPLNYSPSDDLATWADWIASWLFAGDDVEQQALKGRLCLVSDNVFSFLLEIGTQITARIRIDDETKTVAKGALWYEEALPAESILSSLVLSSNVKSTPEKVFTEIEKLTQKTIQFGGSATVGQGLCQTYLAPKEAG